jgi:hypothetical protein
MRNKDIVEVEHSFIDLNARDTSAKQSNAAPNPCHLAPLTPVQVKVYLWRELLEEDPVCFCFC